MCNEHASLTKVKKVKLGPILGHTTMTSIKVLGRLTSTKYWLLVLKVTDSNNNEICHCVVPTLSRFDGIGFMTVEGLTQNTIYKIQMGKVRQNTVLHELTSTPQQIDSSSFDWSAINSTEAKTFPTNNESVETNFVLTSCRHPGLSPIYNQQDKVLKLMAEKFEQVGYPDFQIACGDQIYADHIVGRILPVATPARFEGFCRKYKQNYNKAFTDVASKVPTYCTFDDHEIVNDWSLGLFQRNKSWSHSVLNDGLRAFDTYQGSLNPSSTMQGLSQRLNANYVDAGFDYTYEFQHGRCGFFAMDVRYERIEGPAFDKKKKDWEREIDGDAFEQMISDSQIVKLETYLKNPNYKVKFVISSVPFFPDTSKQFGTPYDKWKGGFKQRKAILKFIELNDIRNVVFLSGDVHCSLSAKLKLSNGILVHNIISSALNWPIFGLGSQNFLFGNLYGAEEYESTCISRSVSGDKSIADPELKNNFTSVSVKTTAIEITITNSDGLESGPYKIKIE